LGLLYATEICSKIMGQFFHARKIYFRFSELSLGDFGIFKRLVLDDHDRFFFLLIGAQRKLQLP